MSHDYLRDGYKVGEYGFILVGVGGTVTGLTKDTITFNGQQMPLTLGPGPGVRYISQKLPPESDGDCEDCAQARDEMSRAEERVIDLVRANHDNDHAEPWVICTDWLCRRVQEQGVLA